MYIKRLVYSIVTLLLLVGCGPKKPSLLVSVNDVVVYARLNDLTQIHAFLLWGENIPQEESVVWFGSMNCSGEYGEVAGINIIPSGGTLSSVETIPVLVEILPSVEKGSFRCIASYVIQGETNIEQEVEIEVIVK